MDMRHFFMGRFNLSSTNTSNLFFGRERLQWFGVRSAAFRLFLVFVTPNYCTILAIATLNGHLRRSSCRLFLGWRKSHSYGSSSDLRHRLSQH